MGPAGTCTIHLSWILPQNTDTLDVTHFAVSINGTNIANETNNFNQSLSSTAYTLCSCASHNVSISAVNRCGSVGQSSPTITVNTLSPLPVLDNECMGNCVIMTCGASEIGGKVLNYKLKFKKKYVCQ